MKTIIPVVLSSDDKYAKYLGITLVSVLSNAQSDTFYDIYILMAPDFSERSKELILKDAEKYPNNKINFVDMKNAFSSFDVKRQHLTIPTFYRLTAAEILPEQYTKCIYFDTDVAVNIDLKEIFNEDIGKNIIGGVKDAGTLYDIRFKIQKLFNKNWDIPNYKNYVNAGVLILNLDAIRKNKLTSVFVEEAQKNFIFADQDVINKVSFGKVKNFPLQYNVMTYIKWKTAWPFYLRQFNKNEMKQAIKNPKIIHYGAQYTPWLRPKTSFGEYWWKYAITSSFTSDILKANCKTDHKKKIYLKKVQRILQKNKVI